MPKSTMVRRWLLTINNEERSDEELKKYIEDLEHFKYCMFQREKGSETGTEHIQAFIIFSIGKRLETVKNYFPRAHLEQVKGSNSQARDYCSKSDTRVSGPFELGQFAEERERTDIKEFLALIENNSSNIDIKKLFPNLYVKNYDKIDKLRQEELFTEYESKIRNVEVTYIYGVPGIGKTSYVYKLFGFKDVYRITSYNKNLFDNY
jgi:signal recognition particle GTPase